MYKNDQKKLLDHARSIIPEITVEEGWTEEELYEAGRVSHNEHALFARGQYGDTSFLCTGSRTLQRWAVNFVRHKLTNYEAEWHDMAGKT